MILYDNLKSAVLERRGDAIRFHPTLLSLAAHYRFEPRPCSPARGNEKGRVERAIRYIRDNFFAAREWKDLEDLNAQAMAWAEGPAADRKCPGDTSRTVRDAFFEEQSKLLSPGDNPFPIEERVEVNVGKTPYVRFDLNDYSIPSTHVRRTLVVNATVETVRILDGYEVLATHARSWDRSTVIENPDHVAELVDRKRQAREHRGVDRLHHAVPTSRLLLQDAAERGGNIGGLTSALTRLLDTDGPAILEAAITEVIELGTPHIGAIRHVLDRMRKARGEPPPLAVELPDDPRIRNIVALLGFLRAAALAFDLDDLGAMHESVDERDDARCVGEDVVPLGERLAARGHRGIHGAGRLFLRLGAGLLITQRAAAGKGSACLVFADAAAVRE